MAIVLINVIANATTPHATRPVVSLPVIFYLNAKDFVSFGGIFQAAAFLSHLKLPAVDVRAHVLSLLKPQE